ncbi:uncharacterized protein L969DRAFT_52435 [Mixia osmundae IAM 14324]|uniref:Peptidase A1 domain-containing protein n=1 Tax=Mixia osmundae (strain CBS 9802 / IAM 14324 / JCM 22182 / KY 12970) TaxID=764103 RepID=G7E4Q5_MIXOS|nr:uncharacterized protein L969DRAFT_52435 [Mixia osmundae IAM 14324]KEI37667.1 hypothetical protein L969DRAFT_52435 [Mixia osmundae IAM 14324]GAA97815.1 hypothetical protein E5Q_04494 [Mixia osmundae IAM 14324]
MIAPNLILGSTDFGVVKQIRTGSTTSGYTGVFALGPQAGLDGQMKSDTFSTWMTGATDAGIVPRNVVTIDLDEPSLTLGYVNLDNAVGELVYLPCLEAESWQVKIGMPQIGFDGSMIVDTGAPLFILTPTAMQMLMKYIPGSKLVEGTRILLVPADHLPKDLTFMARLSSLLALRWADAFSGQFGNLEFVLPGKEQLLGAATRRDWHGFVFSIFQQIADMPAGVDAIMGSKILQHLIVVLDDDNQQIGFAARKRT